MHDRPGLVRVLDEMPPEERPSLVLVDSTCRTSRVTAALRQRNQPCLLKLATPPRANEQ